MPSFTVPVPPAGTSLTFSPTATTIDVNGAVALNNADWTRTTSPDGTRYVFTLNSGTISAYSASVVGLVLSNDTFTSASPSTPYDLDVVITAGSGGDSNPTNDTDSVAFAFTPPVSTVDFPPILQLTPGSVTGTGPENVSVTLVNLSGTDTNTGPIVTRIPKDPRMTATSVSGTGWTLDSASDAGNYVLTYTGTVAPEDESVPGALAFTWTNGSSDTAPGTYTITGRIDSGSGGDTNAANNSDSETLQFFPAPKPDFAPSVTLNPSSFIGNDTGTITVGLTNVSAATNTGPITTLVPKNSGISAVTIAGTGWTLDAVSDPANFALTYTGTVSPGGSAPSAVLSYTWTEPTIGIVGQSGSLPVTATVVTGSGGDSNAGNNVATATLSYGPDKYLVVQAEVVEPTRPAIMFHVANASTKSTWTVASGSMSASIELSTPVTSYDLNGDPSGQDDGMGTTMVSIASADSSQQENFVGQSDGPTYTLSPGEVAQDPFTGEGEFVNFVFNGTLPPGSYSAVVTFNYTLNEDSIARTASQTITWTVPAP